jgi:hypothetical protein
VDDTLTQGAVPYGHTASYVEVSPGDADSAIAVAGSATALLSFTPTAVQGPLLHLLAYGGQGALKQVLTRRQRG